MKQFNKVQIVFKKEVILDFLAYPIPTYNKGEWIDIKGTDYKITKIEHKLSVSDDGTKVDTNVIFYVRKKLFG